MADVDVVVVGAGPAGLSCALYLARYLRTVALFDAGAGRWAHHQVNHNYLGFPEGVRAHELHDLGVKQLAPYDTVTLHEARVTGVGCEGEDFVTSYGGESVRSRAVVLATGVVDHYPHFPGWEDYVGRSLFWCMTCDGYESRGAKTLVLGGDDHAAVEAVQLRRYTEDIAIVTNGPLSMSDDVRGRLHRREIPLYEAKVEAAVCRDQGPGLVEHLVLDDGRNVAAERIFTAEGATPQTELARQLGCRLGDNGHVEVDRDQRTNVPLVYAAGDVTRHHSHQVTTAVHEGAQAASACTYDLYPPDLR